ncbi:MAG: Bax inhibitor-1/YccA family protein [Sarcina sp.]
MNKGNPIILKGLDAAKGKITSNTMSVGGTAIKSTILLIIVGIAFLYSYDVTIYNYSPALTVSGIIAFIAAIITSFVPKISMFTGPIYAAFEGFALGALANMLNNIYPGIAMQAVIATIIVALVTFVVYAIMPSSAARTNKLMTIGLISIAIIYFISFLLSFVGIMLPFLGNGIIGIGFSIFVVIIASLSLLTDFDNIAKGSRYGAPKYMEWYCAFGLTVTLIWLYMEILNLFAKIQSRD